MDFKEIFEKADNAQKIAFLFSLLESNSELRTQFINEIDRSQIVEDTQLFGYDEFVEEVNSMYEEYKSDMESLELEDFDWENYTPRHSGYIAEWEATQHMAEEEADMLFENFTENITSMLLAGQLENVLIELISFYFAANDADINDPCCNLSDSPNDYFINKHNEFFEYSMEKISISSFPDNKIMNTIGLFFKYFETEKQDKPEQIKTFEPILVLLLNKINNSQIIPDFEKITSIDKRFCPVFSITVEERSGNSEAWLEQAHESLLLDIQIGKKLLDYYLDDNKSEYIDVANKLFMHDKRYWAKEVEKNLKIENDQDLYKKVQVQLCINERKTTNYLNVKDILSQAEKEDLHEELNYNYTYRVEIYNIEKQYDKIKEIVDQDIDSWSFNELIEPILNVYPEYCFLLIRKKSLATLEKERSRGTYKRIASWLKQAQKIKSFETKTRELIMSLYNHKPNLPALKDEFRISGVV